MNSTPPLASADLTEYQENGILFPVPVLGPDEAEYFRKTVEEMERLMGPRSQPSESGDRPLQLAGECHLNFKWAYDLCTHGGILDVVEQIIGPDIIVHSSTLFSKPPGENFVSWHQDGHYWELSEPRLVSAWVALSDSTVENGCMRVQPGTHFFKLDHAEVHHERNMLGTGSTVQEGFDESKAVDVTLKPGEMSLHHANLLHGSNPNRSSENRIGYAIRYVAADVNQGRGHHKVTLARGEDRFHYYDLLREPPMCSVEEGIPIHIAYSERMHQLDLDGLEHD